MIYQIAGTVIISTALICLTWYGCTLKRLKAQKEREARRSRYAHNEKMNETNTYSLYMSEEQRRKEAEVKIGILNDQLRRSRNEAARLKKLIADMEAEGGLNR